MWFVVALSLLLSIAACVLAWRARPDRTNKPDLDLVPADLLGLRQEVAALKQEVGGALRHVAVVRYDAFSDMGGQLSWSVALLDDSGNGVLLTSIHGRAEARTYARTVNSWACDLPLSEEEAQAVKAARP